MSDGNNESNIQLRIHIFALVRLPETGYPVRRFALMSSSNSEQENNENKHDSSAPVKGEVGPLASFRIRNFRFLITGTTLSNAAQWIQQVTLNWLVYDMTGSGTILGSINLVRAVATLGIIPIAGLLIDRLNRKMLMMMTNGWLFIITFVLGLLLILGQAHISFIFVFVFLGGLSQAVDMSLRQVVIFDLVPREYTPNAVALVQTGWGLMRSIGPAIGGYLILFIGAGGNFLVQASAYVLIAFSIMQIQFPVKKQGNVPSSPLRNIKEGLQYAIKQRVTRTFMMMGWILPLFIIPNFVALPAIYAKDVFHGGPGTLGILLASIGLGSFIGGLFTASLGRFERRGLLQLVALFLLCLSLIGFAFSTELWQALGLLAISGFFEMIFLTTNQTLLQLSIPDHIRGRVTSVVNLNSALSPLGSFLAGVGSDLMGGPKWVTVILCGIAAGIAILVLIFSKTVRDYNLSREISSNLESSATGS